MTVINLCDFCGERTRAGKNQEFSAVWITPRRTKEWRKGHTESRYARVQVRIGIDGCNPEMEHAGHDLCTDCQVLLLQGVIERLETKS